MTGVILTMLAALSQVGAVIPSKLMEPPILPSTKWELQVENNSCVLSRYYGMEPSGTTLVVRKRPLLSGYDLAIFDSVKGSGVASNATGKKGATIVTRPRGRTIRADFDTRVATTAPKRRVTILSITDADLADIAIAEDISISIGSGASTALAIRNGVKAAAGLKTCSDDLLREWKIDPAESDLVATPPIAEPAAWLSDDDYPAAAMGAQGLVFAVFKVDTDGHVADCRTVGSSGSAILDETTCRLIAKRARFKPAIGKNGQPIAMHRSISFTWRRR